MSSTFNEDQAENKQVNITSIFSLALGILGWSINILGAIIISDAYSNGTLVEALPIILSCLSWLAAMITGFIGLKQIKASPSEMGRWLAVPSLIISGFGLIKLACALSSVLLQLTLMRSTPPGF